MQIIGGAATDMNLLQSNSGQYRNEDFAVGANTAFIKGQSQGATASNYSHMQLYNPVGSGVSIIIDGVYVSVSAATYAMFRSLSTELTTSLGSWDSKLMAQPDGNGVIRREANVAQLGTAMYSIELLANEVFSYKPQSPIILPAGQSLTITTNLVNVTLSATFEGREV